VTIETVNGVRLHYEVSGNGDVPLVLVHGSWGSLRTWDPVVPALGESFRVLTYDRRGHGDSESPGGQGCVRDDVADLAMLIEGLGLAPAYVAGNSFGASITLRLACERPDLLRGAIAHEPPLFALILGDPGLAPVLTRMVEAVHAVAERIEGGDYDGAAVQFMTMALAPGEWRQVPDEIQKICTENAPTFLDESNDGEALNFERDWIKHFSKPVLLTLGEKSPPQYSPILKELAEVLPQAELVTFADLGHLPHVTRPPAYVNTLSTFIRKCEES